MQHPDEGRLHEYADGALSASETAALERHLAECAACRAALGEVHALLGESDRLVARLELDPPLSAPTPRAARAPRRWYQSRTLGLAASALLVLGVGYLAVGRGRPAATSLSKATDDVAALTAPVTTAEPPAASGAAAADTPRTLAQAEREERTSAGRDAASGLRANEAAPAEGDVARRAMPDVEGGVAAAAPAPAAAMRQEVGAVRADTPPAKRADGVELKDLPTWKPKVAAEAQAAGAAPAPRFGIEGLQAVSHDPLPEGGTRSVYSVNGIRVELDQGPGARPANTARSAQYEVSWTRDGTPLTLRAALPPAEVEALRARVR